MEYPDLTELEGRSKRYWDVDGIPEFVMGSVFMLWGAAFVLRDLIPRGYRFAEACSWAIVVGLVISGWVANWIIKVLKNKYTFPRAGYVKFLEPTRSKRLLYGFVGGLSAAAFAIVFVLSMKNRAIADLSGPAIGLIMACGFLVVSRRPGMHHFIWYSLFSLVLGAALYPLKLEWAATWWYFIGIGAAFAVGGACRLRAFVRSIPLPGGNEL
ncbi:MAG TPA: hypothetical protein VMG30_03590 [Acidobacteriota bacterium]|nr:hypothetical protein [Acidobacteriota bacterium]